jgi:hypothetical protein
MTYCTREAQAMALDGARGTSLIRESARALILSSTDTVLHVLYEGCTSTETCGQERYYYVYTVPGHQTHGVDHIYCMARNYSNATATLAVL